MRRRIHSSLLTINSICTMFKKLLDWMFTSNEEFRLRESNRVNEELIKVCNENLNKSDKMLRETCAALTAEKERSRKLEEERDACIKQLIEERDKAQDEANCAWDELNKAKVKALELQSEIDRLNENVVRLGNHSSELHAALAAEKEKCEKLEAEKERAWTNLESTEDALEVLNEKLNKEIIEKETAFVAWERQSEKERKILDCWRSKVVVLKRKLKKSEALCREFKNELNFAVAELNAAKASLSIRQQPSNLEIAALIYNQGKLSHLESVQDAAYLRKVNDAFIKKDAKPKNS